jgi:hypothetical protein
MNADLQSWVALAIVVAATLWLTLRSLRSKKSSSGGCGSCGCDIKDKLGK